MAIKYTRRIPRESDIHNANIQRYEAAKALADTYNQTGNTPTTQESAPMSEYDKERERIRNRFTAPINDDNNVWVQSAKRGQAAIDNGQQLKPTPEVGSYEFATRTLPSGSENNYIRYDTVGEDLNDVGRDWLRSKKWTNDQINNFNNNKYNYGFMQVLEKVGGLDHTQAMFEAYLREKRRQQMAYEAAIRQNYGPAAAQDAMALGVPDDSGSTGADEGFDMPGNSVADFCAMDNAYAQPSTADYYQLDAQTYKDPWAYHDAHDPLIRGFNELRAYNRSMRNQNMR